MIVFATQCFVAARFAYARELLVCHDAKGRLAMTTGGGVLVDRRGLVGCEG